MCGLCGAISRHLITSDKNLFTNLLFLSVLRGSHSTGLIRIGTSEEKKVKKRQTLYAMAHSLEPSVDYVRTEDYKKFVARTNTKVILGHCRHATKGDVTLQNCHPFEVGNIVGQHNGTINRGLLEMDKFETDSEALMHGLNTEGVQETIDRVGHNGSYAISWFDKKDCTINLLRNDGRPLFISEPETAQGEVYYASEKPFLEAILSRSGSKYKDIRQLPAYTQLSFPVYPGNNPVEEVWKTEYKRPVYSHGYTSNWNRNGNNPVTKGLVKQPGQVWCYTTRKWVDPEPKEKDTTPKKMSNLPDKKEEANDNKDEKKTITRYKAYNGEEIDQNVLEGVLADGCAYCSNTPELTDFANLTFISRDQFLCGECDGTSLAVGVH